LAEVVKYGPFISYSSRGYFNRAITGMLRCRGRRSRVRVAALEGLILVALTSCSDEPASPSAAVVTITTGSASCLYAADFEDVLASSVEKLEVMESLAVTGPVACEEGFAVAQTKQHNVDGSSFDPAYLFVLHHASGTWELMPDVLPHLCPLLPLGLAAQANCLPSSPGSS
jgi:hypothetical protein